LKRSALLYSTATSTNLEKSYFEWVNERELVGEEKEEMNVWVKLGL
jgi:hypothetical protein